MAEDQIKQSILDQVEKRLKAAQENKKFKDVGRKRGTRKEANAFKVVNLENILEIEESPSLAEKLVTKKRIWPEVDIDAERAKGTTSGAAYLKYEYHKALASKPLNSKPARLLYVKFIEIFREALEEARTVSEVIAIGQKMLERSFLESLTGELDAYQAVQMFYGKGLDKVLGKTFTNLAGRSYGSTESAKKKIQAAKIYERFSPEDEAEVRKALQPSRERQLERFKEALPPIKEATTNEQLILAVVKAGWNIDDEYIGFRGFEKTKEYWIGRIQEYIDKYSKPAELHPWEVAREDDWTWYTVKPEKKTSTKSTGPKINQYEYLSQLVRKGGIEVSERDNKAIKEKYDFAAIQYGNSLTDEESAWMTWLLNGAMMDLQELINVDVRPLHRAGKLGIDFATRGTPGSAATYWASVHVINLNRRNGDGSLAHEWGHFLDNMLSKAVSTEKHITLNGHKGHFSTQHHAADPEIDEVIQKLMNFIIKGNGTEYVERAFEGKSHGFRIYAKDTLEDTVAYYTRRYPKDFRNPKKSVKLYEQIVSMFGLSEAKIKTPIGSSYQYYDSARIGSAYWVKDVELFARAFEGYVMFKMEEKGIENQFLQSSRTYFLTNYGLYPYPQKTDLETIVPLFDKLFDLIRRKYDASLVLPSSIKRVDMTIDNKSLDGDKKFKPSIEEKQEDKKPETMSDQQYTVTFMDSKNKFKKTTKTFDSYEAAKQFIDDTFEPRHRDYDLIVPKSTATEENKEVKQVQTTIDFDQIDKPKEVRTHFYKKEEEAKKKATGKKFNNAERKAATAKIRKIVDEAVDNAEELTPEQVIAIAKKINSERSLYSQFVDANSDSKIQRAPTKKNLETWAKNPGKSDIIGVDSDKATKPTLKRDQGFAMRLLRRRRS